MVATNFLCCHCSLFPRLESCHFCIAAANSPNALAAGGKLVWHLKGSEHSAFQHLAPHADVIKTFSEL